MEVQKEKGFITEEGVSLLLQRYSATTILSLLQEISQCTGAKIDWKTLAKRTPSGISSAREYQMLWRHLAYNDTLLEKLEDDAEPLDNDSDLEFEIEAVPAVNSEALSEAAACVKVLISSGLQRDSCTLNRSTVEGPLTINVPNDQQQIARCSRGTTNITVPVSVQRQPLHTGSSGEVLDENGPGSGLHAKKKRKMWTDEEDNELVAAVQKCGEGNWANILKGDFKHDRTAAQLSQRWSTIRKRERESSVHLGGAIKSNGLTRSQERLAAQAAFTTFVDMPNPIRKSSSARCSGVAQSNTPATSTTLPALLPEAPSVPAQSTGQSRNDSDPSTTQKAHSNSSNKPRTTHKRPALAPSTCSNSLIQKAAIAAGGRIASPSTAASLYKATQSKTARPTVPAHPKLPVAGPKPSPATETTDFSVNSESQGRPHLRPPVMPPPPVNSGTVGPRIGSQPGKDESAVPANFVESTQQGTKSSAIVAEAVLMKEAGAVDRMELDAVVVLPSDENTVVECHADLDINILKPRAPECKNGNIKAVVDMAVDDGGAQIPEIATGGPNVTAGYFNNEEKTKEVYKEKRMHPDGCLEIIDPKKDIVKLQHGACGSLGKVEAVLIVSPYVDNIMLHTDPLHSYCVALVVPAPHAVENWASKQGISYIDFADLCRKEETVKEVHGSLVKVARQAHLEKSEIPSKIKLVPEAWSPESGLVTATLELKRENIRKAFAEQLSKLYS